MGWKQINGRRYFYKLERDGNRVRSVYFGAGAAGQFAAPALAEDREQRRAERQERQAEREEAEAEERAISGWFDDVQAVADAAVVAAGFHKHKGQWRRKRR